MESCKINRLFKVFIVAVVCFSTAAIASEKDQPRPGLRTNSQKNTGNRNWRQNSEASKFSDSIKLTANIPYAGTDNDRQKLDMMLPAERDDLPLPVIVFIHGGGWRAGNRKTGLRRISEFVASGQYAGVSVGYRLTGEAVWPAQIHDCKAAIRWVRANAKKYNFDPDRIGVWGTSAGGHLVAMLGTSGGIAEIDGKLGPNSKESARVTCVVDFFGPTDFIKMNQLAKKVGADGQNSPGSPVYKLLGGPLKDNLEKASQASPVTHVSKDDPPFLMVHGTKDPLVSLFQSRLLDGALEKVKVESTLITVEGGGHGRGFGKDINKIVARFLDHHLRGNKSKWQDKTVKATPISKRPN